MNNVFGLDIGTRNVVGTVGYLTEEDKFIVVAQYMKQHETRSMLDGQIHDIGKVAHTIAAVKAELESQTGEKLEEVCIAAAGRVLRTVTTHVEYEYAEETVVSGEDIHTLDLLGVEAAQDILKEKNDTKYHFYCVGYSVVKYYLNDELYISIEGHKANKIGEDIIVTFLPEDVVDGLYAAVGLAGLTVANMTLEPIAAINVAIPENYRMLNLALVDVGAGTSDISITKEGSIIAYGMIPYAGDELTEVIVQHYLVDFSTAEEIKLQSTEKDEVTYEDIMNISHTIPSKDVWDLVAPVVDKITSEVADGILKLNGDNPVSACFVVGGGGKIHGFTDMLAEYLDLPEERVALRGEEVLKEVTFMQEDIKKDPLLVTPIGICLNYYEQKNNFIMVRFNGERLKLYDNNRLTIVDAALQAGFPNDQLFPRRGMPINFTVNGTARMVRGEAGEPAIVTMNGKPANINTPLEPNCEITIEPSTVGDAAVYTIAQLDEYNQSEITFIINGRRVRCPKFVEVNGELEPPSYEIKDGDAIDLRNYFTVEQIISFMDVEVDMDRDILVNNRPAELDTMVYENFSIEWTTLSFGVAAIEDEDLSPATDTEMTEPEQKMPSAEDFGVEDNDAGIESAAGTEINSQAANFGPEENGFGDEAVSTVELELDGTDTAMPETVADTVFAEQSAPQPAPMPEPAPPLTRTCTVLVNNERVELTGKESYIFVDIFDHISFDLSAGGGRGIVTLINGGNAEFSQKLNDGDRIELYWKEI
ncbi:MAG: rod shape-determining protein [Clostridiales bacterium]|nr:rod shape-determining protein [Clostridiales bacterium]